MVDRQLQSHHALLTQGQQCDILGGEEPDLPHSLCYQNGSAGCGY
jgi:hypothetical protein